MGMGLVTTSIPSWHPAPTTTREGVEAARKHAEQRGFKLSELLLLLLLLPLLCFLAFAVSN